MIIMDQKLLGKEIVFPSLQSSHKSIKFPIIGGVVDVASFKFLTKVGYGVSFLEKHDANTNIGGITFNFKKKVRND